MLEALLFLAIVAGPSPRADQDSDPGRTARAAAYRYENLLRDRAPYYSGPTGGECDEVVGRFCLRFGFDDDVSPPAPEHPDIAESRRRVIGAYRAWIGGEPESGPAAGGLVRYLIEDGRPREAVAVARAHVAASPGTESLLFLGLALHSGGAHMEAEAAFDSARALAGPAGRRELDDVRVLLSPGERDRYEKLDPAARAAYERRLWAFSDPSQLAAGNERRAEHYARHAWIRILDDAPRARGAVSWGDDHAEITLRYGVPLWRERVRRPPFRLEWEQRVVSRFSPGSVSLVPAALLTEGVAPTPEPGTPSALDRDAAPSSYRPLRLPGLRGLQLQVTRIPAAGGWTLRVDAILRTDSRTDSTATSSLPAPEALLTVLDTIGAEVGRTALAVETAGPSLVIRGELPLPPGTYVYQAEAVDTATGVAGRALHRVEMPAGRLAVADPLVAAPTGLTGPTRRDLRPFPTRRVAVGRTVTVWSAVRGLSRVGGASRYTVEWWLERRDRGTALGRAVRWLGRALGLAGEERPVRVRWEDESREAGPVPIVFELTLDGVEPGRYRLGLRVRDRVSGAASTSYRSLLLEEAPRP